MGAVDIVPGVSGGTVALVLGIYRRLIDSMQQGALALSRLVRLDIAGARVHLRAVEWGFIIPLVVGIISAILILAGPIESALERAPVPMAGLFFGLVAGSVVIAMGLLPQVTRREVAIVAGVGLITFLGLGLGASGKSEGIADPPLWAYPASAAIAVCAMILPGISGSFLLVMMGMYAPVLAAASSRDWAILLLFTMGAVVGLALFSRVLHWALQHHYATVLAAMIGLMVGSARILWPWPDGLNSTELGAPSGEVGITLLLALLGLGIVIGFDLIAHRLEHRGAREEAADLQA